MDFRQKIDKILTLKGIKLYKLAEISGLGNTLEKAYAENREMKQGTTDRFIQKVGINYEWWKTQKGDILNENNAQVNEPAINKNLPYNEEREILIRTIDRMGNYIEHLLKEKGTSG